MKKHLLFIILVSSFIGLPLSVSALPSRCTLQIVNNTNSPVKVGIGDKTSIIISAADRASITTSLCYTLQRTSETKEYFNLISKIRSDTFLMVLASPDRPKIKNDNGGIRIPIEQGSTSQFNKKMVLQVPYVNSPLWISSSEIICKDPKHC